MFRSILKLNGVKQIEKQQQQIIKGGGRVK